MIFSFGKSMLKSKLSELEQRVLEAEGRADEAEDKYRGEWLRRMAPMCTGSVSTCSNFPMVYGFPIWLLCRVQD
ncbi:hypothetical protein TSAR_001172 [Trichomalopsis sarcophagae]|uniref:Uncharacterized protein n=1 Tax=Trichomalopsis sarcophagae TaxID=543379 RepID=A0A232FNC2_9HYME|nr:hypothetical protein TSAR_001172 [Trichomalopsis sarcophagae]